MLFSKLPRLSMVVFLLILGSACGPIGPIPGGKLAGALQSLPLSWQELAAQKIVQIETQVGFPQSYNIWAVSVQDEIYIAAAAGNNTSWVQSVLRNPRITIKISGNLYSLIAERVEGTVALKELVYKRYNEKYDLSQIDQSSDDMWLFRLRRT